MTAPPVLLIAFNRPNLVRRQLDVLRTAGVRRLFVAVDGPRSDRPEDLPARAEVLAAIDGIDWECDVEHRVLDDNVGLNAAVVGAVDWFFTRVDRGVILEDDCIARPEFFEFAAELLDRYADDERVMMVSGSSLVDRPDASSSYLTAGVGHIWGWATWRRAWDRYDDRLPGWVERRSAVRRSGPLGRGLARKFDSHLAGRKARWARAWYHAMIAHDGVALIPTVNLVENDGFGSDATNTVGATHHPLRRTAAQPMQRPLRHPVDLAVDPGYERLLARYHARSLRDRTADRLATLGRWSSGRLRRPAG